MLNRFSHPCTYAAEDEGAAAREFARMLEAKYVLSRNITDKCVNTTIRSTFEGVSALSLCHSERIGGVSNEHTSANYLALAAPSTIFHDNFSHCTHLMDTVCT